MLTHRLVRLLLLSTICALLATARAEAAEKSKGMGLWNVDQMVKQACDQLIRRYKLNEDQAAYTRQLMSKRVNKLLDKHEDKIRQLFREAMAMRMAGKPPSVEAIKSWSQRAKPIYDDAKKEILEGNDEWSAILTPEQKKTHDIDVKMMKIDFANYETRLDRWSKGGFDAKKDWRVRQPRKPVTPRRRTEVPKQAKKPEQGGNRFKDRLAKAPNSANLPPGVTAGPSRLGERGPETPGQVTGSTPQVLLDPEHFWDTYVRSFIGRYRLDSGQRTQAYAMLKECKERARRHRDAHREDYLRVHALIRQLRKGGNTEAAARANEELAELDGPIDDLFEELKKRLDSIPTSAQLQRYQQAKERREKPK